MEQEAQTLGELKQEVKELRFEVKELTLQVTALLEKMNNHINFVDKVYSKVKYPIDYVMSKMGYRNALPQGPLEEHEMVTRNELLLENE